MADKSYVVKAAGAYVKRAGGERMDFLHRGHTFTGATVDAEHLKVLIERDIVVEGSADGGLAPVQGRRRGKQPETADGGDAAATES